MRLLSYHDSDRERKLRGLWEVTMEDGNTIKCAMRR